MSTSTNPIGTFPHHPNDVTPQWLTARLKLRGLLTTSCISSITPDFLGGVYLAKSAILQLSYDQQELRSPLSLFIKITEPDEQFGDVTAGEAAFFRQELPAHLPIVNCIDVCIDSESGKSCILLDDLSLTHMQPTWPLPPTVNQCESILQAFAQIHGHWWNSSALESTHIGSPHHTRQQNIANQLPIIIPKFIEFIGDGLTAKRREIMRDVCHQLPELLSERILNSSQTTLLHGDPHLWNIMIPINPNTHRPVFIDWEEWTRGVCGYDLAYMIAFQWNRNRREHHEMGLLSCYYKQLKEIIDTNYSFENLLDDYRLGCLRNFMIPAFQHAMGLGPACWWQNMEQMYLAFDDLECRSLLK